MAKVCPLTNCYVLYLDCQECDKKEECMRETYKNRNMVNEHLNTLTKEYIYTEKEKEKK